MFLRGRSLQLSLLCLTPVPGAGAEEGIPGARVDITAPLPREPGVTVLDPRAAPAPDGAERLRGVPGFAIIRKGGVAGDPVLRGMTGSRLGVLLEGEPLLGGCGRRMDPPTAYLPPGAFDRVVLVKGPQTVLQGPMNPAGTLLFQRNLPRREATGMDGLFSAGGGTFGHREGVLDLRGGTPAFQARGTGTFSRSGDVRDGDGQAFHTHHRRWSLDGTLAWTPTGDTTLELSGTRGDGAAAYADRPMDGAGFLRERLGFRAGFRRITEILEGLEIQGYHSRVDHFMDDDSLRPFTPTAQFPEPSVMNPDRRLQGGRFALELRLAPATRLVTGMDARFDEHRSRVNPSTWSLPPGPRRVDARFRQVGGFAELDRAWTGETRMVAGIRVDRWDLEDARPLLRGAPNPTAGQRRDRTLLGGFLRWEREEEESSLFLGLGHAPRFPDYWEAMAREGPASPSAFPTRPERTTQLDAGWLRSSGALRASLSVFCGRIQDFMLIQVQVPRPGRQDGATATRNVEALTWGGEARLEAPLGASLHLDATLAWVRGENLTDRRPLPQIPPLDVRVGLERRETDWNAGLVLRGVARQNRFARDQGTIVGQDLGPTPAFITLGLQGNWEPAKGWRLAAGVENALDRAYAEHLNRRAVEVPGYGPPPLRVPEPGRSLWWRVTRTF